MNKGFLVAFPAVLVVVLLASSVSAFTVLNIFIDESGDAVVLGETDQAIAFPDGVVLSDGEVSGITTELTSKQGALWAFSYTLADSEINVILPKGATIKSLSNGEIFLNGDQIAVFFEDTVEITYTVEQVPEPFVPSSNVPIALALLAVLAVLVVFLINYANREKNEDAKHQELEEKIKQVTKQSRSKAKKADKIDVLMQVLSEREKLILKKVKQTGKIKSSYLRKMTELPKASFSRHIQELEKKGLIKRSGEGRNKFVELAKK